MTDKNFLKNDVAFLMIRANLLAINHDPGRVDVRALEALVAAILTVFTEEQRQAIKDMLIEGSV